MRENGEVRFRFTGDETQCQRYIPYARTLLGLLQRTHSVVPYFHRVVQLQDGVTVRLTGNSGQYVIEIDVPETEGGGSQGVTSGVASSAAGPLVDFTNIFSPLFGVVKGAPFLPTAPLYKPGVAESVLSLTSPQQRNIVLAGSGTGVMILHPNLRTADSTDVTAVYGSAMRKVSVTTAIQFIGSLAWFKYSTYGWVQADISDMYADHATDITTPGSQVAFQNLGPPFGNAYQWTVNITVQGVSVPVQITYIPGFNPAPSFSFGTVGAYSAGPVAGSTVLTITSNPDGTPKTVEVKFKYYETFQGSRFALGTDVKDWEPYLLSALGNPTKSGSIYTKTVVTRGASFGSVTFNNGVSDITLSVYYPECDDVYTWQVLPACQDVVFTDDADTPIFVIERVLNRDVPDGHISSGSSHGTAATQDVYKYYEADLFEYRRDGTLVSLATGGTTTMVIASSGAVFADANAQANDTRYGKNIKHPANNSRALYVPNVGHPGASTTPVTYDTTTYEQHFAYPAYEIVIMPAQPSDPVGKRRYQVRVAGSSILEGFRAYSESTDDPGQSLTFGTTGYFKSDTNLPVIYDSPVNGFAIGGGDEVLQYGLTAYHVTLNDRQHDSDQVYKQSTTAYFGSIFTATHVDLFARTTFPGQTVALVPPEFPCANMRAVFLGTSTQTVAQLSNSFSAGATSAAVEFPSLAATMNARVAAAQAILAAPGATLLNTFKPLMALYAPFVAFLANGLGFTPATVLLAGPGDYLWIKRG